MARLRVTNPDEPGAITDKRKRRKVIICLNDDGTPDLTSVSDEQKQALGLAPGTTEKVEPVDRDVVRMLVGITATVEAVAVSKALNVPHSVAMVALKPAQDLEDRLVECSARIIDKYGGIGRYADEVMLGALIVAWQAGALKAIKEYKAETVSVDQQKPQPQPHAPATEDAGLPVDATAPAPLVLPMSGEAEPGPEPADPQPVGRRKTRGQRVPVDSIGE